MAWSVDESRVRPFLEAAGRRDIAAGLWRRPMPGRAFPDISAAHPERERPNARKHFKDWKDSKDSKDWKDSKDVKDSKDYKDSKDWKDGKEDKDSKDWKDGKDGPDFSMTDAGARAYVPALAGGGPGEPVDARPSGAPGMAAAAGTWQTGGEREEIIDTLRASRINRFLRRNGLVI